MTPSRSTIDVKTRRYMAAKLRYLQHKHEFRTNAAMAEAVGISASALGRYLREERTIGLDVALLIHRNLGVSLDWLVDTRSSTLADEAWLNPAYKPGGRA